MISLFLKVSTFAYIIGSQATNGQPKLWQNIMETYYHINKDNTCDWKAGDIIDFKGKHNYYWKSLAEKGDFFNLNGQEYTSNLVLEKAYLTYTRQKHPPEEMKGYHFIPMRTLNESIQSLGNSLRLNRELIFETVRKDYYPELPSRQNCIWLLPKSKESLDFWKQTLYGNIHKVFEVTINGIIHRSAQIWLIGGTVSVNDWVKLAHNYWQGKDAGDFTDEILFDGSMKIVNELHGA